MLNDRILASFLIARFAQKKSSWCAVGGILGSLRGSWIGTSTVDWIYGR